MTQPQFARKGQRKLTKARPARDTARLDTQKGNCPGSNEAWWKRVDAVTAKA